MVAISDEMKSFVFRRMRSDTGRKVRRNAKYGTARITERYGMYSVCDFKCSFCFEVPLDASVRCQLV